MKKKKLYTADCFVRKPVEGDTPFAAMIKQIGIKQAVQCPERLSHTFLESVPGMVSFIICGWKNTESKKIGCCYNINVGGEVLEVGAGDWVAEINSGAVVVLNPAEYAYVTKPSAAATARQQILERIAAVGVSAAVQCPTSKKQMPLYEEHIKKFKHATFAISVTAGGGTEYIELKVTTGPNEFCNVYPGDWVLELNDGDTVFINNDDYTQLLRNTKTPKQPCSK